MIEFEGEPDAVERFVRQVKGEAEPEYPEGKLNPDDEGALAFAVGIDQEKRILIVNFNKPITWIGLSLSDARRLHKAIGKKIKKLADLSQPEQPQSTNT